MCLDLALHFLQQYLFFGSFLFKKAAKYFLNTPTIIGFQFTTLNQFSGGTTALGYVGSRQRKMFRVCITLYSKVFKPDVLRHF